MPYGTHLPLHMTRKVNPLLHGSRYPVVYAARQAPRRFNPELIVVHALRLGVCDKRRARGLDEITRRRQPKRVFAIESLRPSIRPTVVGPRQCEQ